MNLLQELSLANCPLGSLHCAFNASVDGNPVGDGDSESGEYVVSTLVVVTSGSSPGVSELGFPGLAGWSVDTSEGDAG